LLLGINDVENKNQEMNQLKISCGYVAKRVLFDGRERKVSVGSNRWSNIRVCERRV